METLNKKIVENTDMTPVGTKVIFISPNGLVEAVVVNVRGPLYVDIKIKEQTHYNVYAYSLLV